MRALLAAAMGQTEAVIFFYEPTRGLGLRESCCKMPKGRVASMHGQGEGFVAPRG